MNRTSWSSIIVDSRLESAFFVYARRNQPEATWLPFIKQQTTFKLGRKKIWAQSVALAKSISKWTIEGYHELSRRALLHPRLIWVCILGEACDGLLRIPQGLHKVWTPYFGVINIIRVFSKMDQDYNENSLWILRIVACLLRWRLEPFFIGSLKIKKQAHHVSRWS